MPEPSFTVEKYGSTFISDEHGSRVIPPGETDPHGKAGVDARSAADDALAALAGFERPKPTVRAAPRRVLAAPQRGPRDLQRGALGAALVDLALVGDRTAPSIVRFYRAPVGLICAVRSRAGAVGFGCARPDVGDAGTFEPTPVWRARVERELRGAVGLPVEQGELDDASGLAPAS